MTPGPGIVSFYSYWLVAAMGMMVTLFSSQRLFAQPIQIADLSIPSKYFAHPRSYRLGITFFYLFCLMIYIIIASYLWVFSNTLSQLLLPDSLKTAIRELDEGLRAIPILFLFTILYVSLFHVNTTTKWNLIIKFRSLIYSFILIPDRVKVLALTASDSLSVPAGARHSIASSTLDVDHSDFEKDRRSLDRIWAELCYVYRWLELQIDKDEDFRFFRESGWRKAEERFDNLVGYVRVAKLAALRYDAASVDSGSLNSTLRSVRETFFVLLACYLVYKSASEASLLTSTQAFGILTQRSAFGRLKYFSELLTATVDRTGPRKPSNSQNEIFAEPRKAAKVKESEGEQRQAGQFLFVSHVTEDYESAIRIVNELESQNIPCWITPRDIQAGVSYDDEIASAIEKCLTVLLIFSDRCNGNKYILREITFADSVQKRIIPFLIENARPKGGISIRLLDLHFIEAFADRKNAIRQLIKEVSRR